MEKWKILKIDLVWELRDHNGQWAYAGDTFEDVRQGFLVLSRLAMLSTSILRSQVERLARAEERRGRVGAALMSGESRHKFVQGEVPHTCGRCGGHRGNKVHEGFSDLADVQALTGQLPGMAGTVTLTAADGTSTWAELDAEGRFSVPLPCTPEGEV